MRANNKTTKAIRRMRGALCAMAMGAALLLGGCGGGGGTSSTSTTTWPPTIAPATSETNTYFGTQSPGLSSVTIDHTSNTFSYGSVSGNFTTVDGFLNLGSAGWALEMLSRAVLVVPPSGESIFAIAAPACQVIPTRTEFAYVATPNPNYGNGTTEDQITETQVGSGVVGVSSTDSGQDWQFGGEVQYILPNGNLLGPGLIFDPTPDPFSGTCAANSQNSSVIATSITVPSELPANFVIGPTGFFIEDRSQSDGMAFVGAVEPASPIDLSQLSGATFLGAENAVSFTYVFPAQLVSFAASAGSSGTGVQLAGGTFPSNNPAATPAANITIDLGPQDPNNNGYFPLATVTFSGSTSGFTAGVPYYGYAMVSNAGGKYSIFAVVGEGGPQRNGFLLFQQ